VAVLITPATEPYDCERCSACCRDSRDGRVLVSADDLLRWRRSGRDDITSQLVPGHFGQQAFGARTDGRCDHLGTAHDSHHCAIYETRGDSCRAVKPGDSACHGYRRARFGFAIGGDQGQPVSRVRQ
jgi:Fe-S-cluster containining protein